MFDFSLSCVLDIPLYMSVFMVNNEWIKHISYSEHLTARMCQVTGVVIKMWSAAIKSTHCSVFKLAMTIYMI